MSRYTTISESNRLDQGFKRIKTEHRTAIIRRATRIVLGLSTMRVYVPGTKQVVTKFFNGISYDDLLSLRNQEEYKKWFEHELKKLAGKILSRNKMNPRILPGYKWGHAAKILNLQMREVVLNSRYFSDKDVERVAPWLYLPMDSIVMKNLRDFGVTLPFSKIKEIDTPDKFYYVQDLVERAAKKENIPKIWFDDVWIEG